MTSKKKITVPRTDMQKVSEEHKARSEEVKIFEQEKPHTGRIIWVRKGKQILIMR